MLVFKGVLAGIAGMIAIPDSDSKLFAACLSAGWWNASSVRLELPAVDVPAPLLTVVVGPIIGKTGMRLSFLFE